MKYMKFSLVAVALIAILSAFATKTNSSLITTKKWGFLEKRTITISGVNYDVILVDDATGEIQGINYDCLCVPQLCTFQADDVNIYSGILQTEFHDFFLASQVDPTLATSLNSTVVAEGQFSRP